MCSAAVITAHDERRRFSVAAAEPAFMPGCRDVLVAARTLIASPERWISDAFAVDAAGAETEPRAADAVAWCSLGAIERATSSNCGRVRAVLALATAFGDGPRSPGCVATSSDAWDAVIDFNDTPDIAIEQAHAQVLAAFDRAISTATASAPPAVDHDRATGAVARMRGAGEGDLTTDEILALARA